MARQRADACARGSVDRGPVPSAWKDGRIGRIDRDDPDVIGSLPDGSGSNVSAGVGRQLAYGVAAFGDLFAAGWALSKTWGRKSGPM